MIYTHIYDIYVYVYIYSIIIIIIGSFLTVLSVASLSSYIYKWVWWGHTEDS